MDASQKGTAAAEAIQNDFSTTQVFLNRKAGRKELTKFLIDVFDLQEKKDRKMAKKVAKALVKDHKKGSPKYGDKNQLKDFLNDKLQGFRVASNRKMSSRDMSTEQPDTLPES